MPDVKFITKIGEEKTLHTPYFIGDIVKVTSAGNQYDSYSHAFEHFWGSESGSYEIPSTGYRSYKPLLPDKKNVWIIVDMVGHGTFSDTIIYFLMSQERKKIVIGENGIELIKHGPIQRIPEKVMQLCH
jgi:hypothetical protein